jgi:broad specificity phosphatase PhoE
VLYSPKYIDARLSSHGEEQCLKARNNSIINSVQIVLVSPLTRALQTAQLVFGGKGIPIVVRPELTESFRYGCDLSGPLEDKPKEFPSFDF